MPIPLDESRSLAEAIEDRRQVAHQEAKTQIAGGPAVDLSDAWIDLKDGVAERARVVKRTLSVALLDEAESELRIPIAQLDRL